MCPSVGAVFGGDQWAPPSGDHPGWRPRHHWPGEDERPPWEAHWEGDVARGPAAAASNLTINKVPTLPFGPAWQDVTTMARGLGLGRWTQIVGRMGTFASAAAVLQQITISAAAAAPRISPSWLQLCSRQDADAWLWRNPALRPEMPIDANGRLLPAPVPPSPPQSPPPPPPSPPPLPLLASGGTTALDCAGDPTRPGCGQLVAGAAAVVGAAAGVVTSQVRLLAHCCGTIAPLHA